MRRNSFLLFFITIAFVIAALMLQSNYFTQFGGGVGLPSVGSSEITPFHKRIVRYHKRISGNVPAGAVQFIGDSFVQGFTVSAVATPAVNYGIGGDTTVGMLARIPAYESLKTARAVVLLGGFNDLWHRGERKIIVNFAQMLTLIPAGKPVILTGVFPIDPRVEPAFDGFNQRIMKLNQGLSEICAADSRCQFVDLGRELVDGAGFLNPDLHDGDGLHLNAAGNAVLISALKEKLASLP